jgi:hypothetical protein
VRPTTDTQLVADGVVEGRLTRRLLGPLELGLGLGLHVGLARARIAYTDATGVERELTRTGPVGAVFDLGAGLSFP